MSCIRMARTIRTKDLFAESWALIADSGFRADVAQLVEHSLGKGEVISSILIIGSRRLEDGGESR
jgi:hypothetical protein